MNYTIGDSVETLDGKVTGFIIDVRGAATGPSYIVKSRAHRAMAFKGEELQPGPAVGMFPKGTSVMLHGTVGTVIGRDGSRYIVETERRMRGFRYPSRHHLHGWEIALCEPVSAVPSKGERVPLAPNRGAA